mmetsp:Transcript_556/g.632  ORF Transcript_556/g.632 Transcript_556/m.632 type:complete len:90 (-) Transcript_556:921-1190(-)
MLDSSTPPGRLLLKKLVLIDLKLDLKLAAYMFSVFCEEFLDEYTDSKPFPSCDIATVVRISFLPNNDINISDLQNGLQLSNFIDKNTSF